MSYQLIRVPRRIDGGDMEIWLTMKEFNQRLVDNHKCVAISAAEEAIFAQSGVLVFDEQLAGTAMQQNIAMKAPLSADNVQLQALDPGTRGGMKAAHIHLDGRIYLLNQKAYKEFSQQLINDTRERLAEASSVSFRQILDIADATIGINR